MKQARFLLVLFPGFTMAMRLLPPPEGKVVCGEEEDPRLKAPPTHHEYVAHDSLSRGQLLRGRLAEEGEVRTCACDEVLWLSNVHPETWREDHRV